MKVLVLAALLMALSYLLGSIPFGKIVGAQKGIDIQKHGSGNIGFANAVRTLGWRLALIVLVSDIAKGFMPTFLAGVLLPAQPLVAILVGVVAIIGHIFPIWLRGKGGKGVATGLGVTLALNLQLGVCGVLIYMIAFSWFRKSAPSSLAAVWCLPLVCYLLSYMHFVYLYFGLALLVTWTHRSNVRQILTLRT